MSKFIAAIVGLSLIAFDVFLFITGIRFIFFGEASEETAGIVILALSVITALCLSMALSFISLASSVMEIKLMLATMKPSAPGFNPIQIIRAMFDPAMMGVEDQSFDNMKLEELKEELKKAIEQEQFEKAALLRNKIDELENKGN